ncbi:MAG: DUF4123 domain-containing protein [Burkholderiales bacterium]|nr:DUF4123 domain-containing protein [Burkholderiales bacterium]
MYLLIDAARIRDKMPWLRENGQKHDSLYRGLSEEELSEVGPWLFEFPGGDAFASKVFHEGWGESWGVLLETEADFETCWRHFRKFLIVKTEEGEELYFRFYDPRVLKIFLPTCDEAQLREFFGPVNRFIVEGDSNEDAIAFALRNGELEQTMMSAASIFGAIALKQHAPQEDEPN